MNSNDLIAFEVKPFPTGISAAFLELETRLKMPKKRKYYGISYCEAGKINYFACATRLPEDTLTSLAPFTEAKLPEGSYLVHEMRNWHQRTEEIGQLFNEMEKICAPDRTRPLIEFYEREDKLHLMLPIPQGTYLSNLITTF